MHAKGRNVHNLSVGKLNGKKPWHRWEESIKVYLIVVVHVDEMKPGMSWRHYRAFCSCPR
jgi:hypothetical protein